MPQTVVLDYFYGKEAEQYSFYRIPKLLFTEEHFKTVSFEAKILYGLMLDRMGLSIKNEWLDEDGRVFIYFTLENVIELLNCGHDKAIRLFAELDVPKGIGLIERKKQGQGKPAKIYIKNFATLKENQTSEITKSAPPEKPEVLTSEKPNSANSENRNVRFGKADTNNTNKNNTKFIETNPSIYQDNCIPMTDSSRDVIDMEIKKELKVHMDEIDSSKIYRKILEENIELKLLLKNNPFDKERLEEIVELMVETVCSINKSIRVGKQDFSIELVKSRMFKLNMSHIEYVMDCINKNTSKIYNIRNYLLTALFNAPVTISNYYTVEVNHDLYGDSDDK